MSQSYPGSSESSVQSKAHGFIYVLPQILLLDLEYRSGLWFLPLAQWAWCWSTFTVQWGITKKMVLLADDLLASLSLAKASSVPVMCQWCWYFCTSDVGSAFPHHMGEEWGRVEQGSPTGLSWATSNVLGSAWRRWFVLSSFRAMVGSNGFIQASYNTSVALFIQFCFS